MANDESVVGCLNVQRQVEFFLDLYGNWIPGKVESQHDHLLLPRFIPEVMRGLKQSPTFRRNTLFGISLSTIIEEDGRLRYSSATELKRSLKLSHSARLALIGTAIDYSLELFWQRSDVDRVWNRIAEMRFEFVTSLTFSVWDRQSRYDQIYNQDRNFWSYDRFTGLGIPTIPFLFFHNNADYDNVLSWLRSHPDVNKIAMLAQFFEQNEDFDLVLAEMRRLQSDCKQKFQFVVVGAASNAKLDKVFIKFPNATIVTHQPIAKAIYGYKTLSNLNHVKVSRRFGHGKLASSNVRMFDDYCQQPRFWSAL